LNSARMLRERASLIKHEIHVLAGWRVDFENLEHLRAQVAERMSHAGRDIDHVVLAHGVDLVFDGQRPLPALDDINVVGVGVMVVLAARATGHEPVEVHVDLLGPERWIDELDLLATAGLHRVGWALIEMKELEQGHLLVTPCCGAAGARSPP
jgi:hypothetical protein